MPAHAQGCAHLVALDVDGLALGLQLDAHNRLRRLDDAPLVPPAKTDPRIQLNPNQEPQCSLALVAS